MTTTYDLAKNRGERVGWALGTEFATGSSVQPKGRAPQDEAQRVREGLTALTNQRGNRTESVVVRIGAGQIGQAIARRVSGEIVRNSRRLQK